MSQARRLVAVSALLALVGCQWTESPVDAGPGEGGPGADGGELLDGGSTDGGDGGVVTWYRDVLPVVQSRCQGCHTSGGIGPFPLASYEQAAMQHQAMAAAVYSGRMPPWMPAEDCQTFRDSRRLTAEEKEVIVRWSALGAPAGDPSDAPLPVGVDGGLPWVDAILQPASAYTPTATPVDDYRCQIIDPQLAANVDLIGFDIEPDERSQVHHVILYSAAKAEAEAQDQSEAGPGWTCFGGPDTSNPQMLGGWVPGTFATQYPSGTGIHLEAGKVIVMQVHYNTAKGAPAPDRTTVRLQYAQTPIPQSKRAYIVPILENGFTLPPHSMEVTASVSSPTLPGKLWAVLPHMHTRGRRIQVDLNNVCLIDIPRWDFGWQQFYFYQQPIAVPAGGTVKLTCTWDNPTSKTIRWGEGTDDEMCINYFYLTSQ